MSYVKIWIHGVWGTKNRIPFLSEQVRAEVISHIRANAKEKGIYIDSLNGSKEHMHCLISLAPEQSLAKVMQLIKGESSFWINRNKLTKYKMGWAVEYFGVSVSESQLRKVRDYIRNQEEHHRTKTWEDELQRIITDYGFEKLR